MKLYFFVYFFIIFIEPSVEQSSIIIIYFFILLYNFNLTNFFIIVSSVFLSLNMGTIILSFLFMIGDILIIAYYRRARKALRFI